MSVMFVNGRESVSGQCLAAGVSVERGSRRAEWAKFVNATETVKRPCLCERPVSSTAQR